MGFQLNTIDFVERRNPIQLLELARVEFLDNCNYCCLRSLIKRIDELQLQTMEKEELELRRMSVAKLKSSTCLNSLQNSRHLAFISVDFKSFISSRLATFKSGKSLRNLS